MFRTIISPIFRSTRLCVTACGIKHPRCYRPVVWKRISSTSRLSAVKSWVLYTTGCNTQLSAPEDGRNYRPKYFELIGIINKPLLLHLIGCLHYLPKWLIGLLFLCLNRLSEDGTPVPKNVRVDIHRELFCMI